MTTQLGRARALKGAEGGIAVFLPHLTYCVSRSEGRIGHKSIPWINNNIVVFACHRMKCVLPVDHILIDARESLSRGDCKEVKFDKIRT